MAYKLTFKEKTAYRGSGGFTEHTFVREHDLKRHATVTTSLSGRQRPYSRSSCQWSISLSPSHLPLAHGGYLWRDPDFPHCVKGVRPGVEIAVYAEANSERRWWLRRCTSVYHGLGEAAHSGTPASWLSLCFVTRSFVYNRL